MRIFTRRRLEHYGAAVRLGVIFAVIVGPIGGALLIRPPATGALFGLVSALVDSVAMIGILGALEIFGPHTRLGRAIAGRPFIVTLVIKVSLCVLVVGAVIGWRLGPRVTVLAADPDTARSILLQIEAALPRSLLIIMAVIFAVFLTAIGQASRLVGSQTYRNIALGRYHQPRREDRFFLFVDIIGSTPVAERLGPLAVHRYLDRVVQVAADPIDDHRGDVFQYVGDEIVVTWTVPEGRPGARPLACLFAIDAALAAAAPDFQRDFGTIPRVRAALHAGEVVAGEIGGSRRSIVFHGDVMNTTARIENATRELGRPFLVSADALRHLADTEPYSFEDLGEQQMRGRQAALRVYAASLSAR